MEKKLDLLEDLESLEGEAVLDVSSALAPLLETTAWIVRNGPKVQQLFRGKEPTASLRVQVMLLKQALTSLRAVHLLVLHGYTAQAATVASALFETRLYSNFILDDDTKASEFLAHTNSEDFVWRPRRMIKFEAESNLRDEPELTMPAKLEHAIRVIGAQYIFLCSLKHGNPIPLRHLAGGRYRSFRSLVMALPDTRPADNVVKAVILTSANNSAFYTLRNAGFAAKDESEESSNWFSELAERWALSGRQHEEGLNGLGDLPFPTIMKR